MAQCNFDEDLVELGRIITRMAEIIDLPNWGVVFDRFLPSDPITPERIFYIIEGYRLKHKIISKNLLDRITNLKDRLTERNMMKMRLPANNEDLFYGMITGHSNKKLSN